MNSTNKKHSILFRGLILVVAFALSILCFPVSGLVALAADVDWVATDHTFLTVDKISDANTKIVNKGATYTIRDAYIGGTNEWKVGDVKVPEHTDGVKYMDNEKNIAYVSSNVKVTYNGAVVAEDEQSFVAANEGTYVVTYSYTYKLGGKEYTNSYDLEVQSVLSSASISFADNNEVVMPSILDLSVKGAKLENGKYKNLNLPLPTIFDEEGEEIENVKFVSSASEVASKGEFVVITANGGAKADEVAVELVTEAVENEEEQVVGAYISGEYFAAEKDTDFATYGAGNYTVKFSYYSDGNFVTSTTKSTQVYSEESKYYTDYKLNLELASDWVDNGQTGVETKLPAAKGVTASDSTPASEAVGVYYKVEVLFTSNKSEGGYRAFTAEEVEKYNKDSKQKDEDGKDIFVASEEKDASGNPLHYYLADPSKFKPLEDGYYTFIYTITDFYGNTVSSAKGAYEYQDIKDETKPTPIIYDASVTKLDEDGKKVPTYENADYKLASQTPANAVVVYAIGMDDNVDKPGTLTRKVMTDETVVKMTIEDYDAYNLVFNYRQTDTTTNGAAYSNLLTNNFLIRKAVEKFEKAHPDQKIDSDAKMLEFLKENSYLIVIDNANIEHIFDLFKTTDAEQTVSFMNIEGVSTADQLKSWLKNQTEEEIAKLGFAYIDVDTTFGARTADKGMGTGYYYIHYIAKDAAGNETDISRRMQVGISYDTEIPSIKFSTTLQTAYTPDSTVKFDVPTASDTQDSYMLVRTMYRYLNDNGVVSVEDKSKENLNELWDDLTANKTMVNGKLLTETYKAYSGDGYIDLTDRDASSYSIELKEAKAATKLQIVVFVYDDMGNANIYGQTVDISNANDQYAPQHISGLGEAQTFNQGDTIEIPTMVVRDDAVAYMGFEVDVKYFANGTTIDIEPSGSYAERKILSTSGVGEFRVHGGSFVASHAGDYQVRVSAKDSSGHTVVSFVNYTVKPRMIIQSPQINAALEKTQTFELDDYSLNDSVEIPAPTVTYDIPKSITYDAYKNASAEDLADVEYVVYGVDENGNPYNYSTTIGQSGFLRPRELGVGDYELKYSMDLLVYNHKNFTYHEMKYEDGKYEGGHLTYNSDTNGYKIVAENGHFVLTVGSSEYVIKLEDGKVVIYLNGNVQTGADLDSLDLDQLNIESWFEEVKLFSLTSDTYNIKIQDTKGPKIAEFDYPTAISTSKLAEDPTLKIFGIQASDAKGIDISKSTIRLSWKLANGTSSSKEWKGEEAAKNQEYKITSSVVDGTYKVTYTVYDNAGNYSTKEYSISVGDTIAPTMTADEDFIASNYEIGSSLTIDLRKIKVEDNNPMPEDFKIEVVLKNNSSSEEIKAKDSDYPLYYFDLTSAGTYTLTLTVEDAVGNTTTKEFTFEVSSKTLDTTTVYRVVGTVLIVVSVLVLAGVIVYFIVSKVKLDKELKK